MKVWSTYGHVGTCHIGTLSNGKPANLAPSLWNDQRVVDLLRRWRIECRNTIALHDISVSFSSLCAYLHRHSANLPSFPG